ncbi:E3 SUMO-protein ligase ZBED1-like [Simochromis diagramma]|uniref:E3 SUMO-protein ligase ZBED1-like n=1 Tax=Simochromis diagramma TaxID=43689 RepID=UPI001A7EFC9B|nr:E3 SUMO-protein ligase ZBED1-like [Simochromis diagramma]
MSATSSVIKFAFIEHKEFLVNAKKKHSAKCRFCKVSLTKTAGTTSTFTRHLERKHPQRYLEYKAGSATSVIAVNPTQPQLSLFAPSIHLFSPNSPRQQAITQSILQDLIVGCSLPLSIVENPHFRHFLNVLDSKYTPVSRTTLTEKLIPHLVTKLKGDIIKALEVQPNVAITTDLWSDRRLRTFLGVTAHAACKNKDSYSLQSFLLDCRRFTGKHCGERIASAFDRIVEEYAGL